VVAAGLGVVATMATAQDIDAKADEVLRAMSDYLGGLGSFSVTADASTDILTRDGAKVQMTATGELVLDRE
jgi:hypothetical protein